MKRMFWIAALLIVAVAVVLTGCARQTPPSVAEADGGVQNDTSYDAPKTIESTQIIAFRCDFSAFNRAEEDTRLAGRAYQLEAKLENGAVKGSYYAHTRYDGERETFREQFKASPGSVLLAAGAAWEGFDFPGDCVSLLIIPRLPFAVPDALKEKERENHPTLRLFIRAVVVPEMQNKLKQGFGRAIRTETDTCVVAILDERAAEGKRYFEDMLAALPEMPITDSLEDVARFIRSVKRPDYFREGCA